VQTVTGISWHDPCLGECLDTNNKPVTMSAHPNPIYIADKAQQLARNAKGDDCAVFQKVALVSMGVMALASASQVLHSLWRDLNRKDDQRRGRGR